MHLISYPDVVYKGATDAILIQTRCVQSVVSLQKDNMYVGDRKNTVCLRLHNQYAVISAEIDSKGQAFVLVLIKGTKVTKK